MAKKKKQECASIPGWLVSFGDLMSLLLTFFILLYSMSTVSVEKFYQSIRGLTEAFGGRSLTKEARSLIKNKVELNFPHMYPKLKKKKRVIKALNEIKALLQKAGIAAEVVDHGNKVLLRVNADNLFLPGSAYPTKEAAQYFMEFCKRFKESGFRIKIIGYTDNQPIHSAEFKNNWELSIYRAINILRLFVSCGYDKRFLTAEGRGEYDPIAPNNTPQGRAKNRRVEFIVDLVGI
ncbi:MULTISPECIES: flagellar motor protein MotB [unclassified Nitratiruptor]|uniref:OmpA/MotB family protein n=1 Tax=unclassified Nitratiruptor TaxID=2624044 RepID=UPI001915B99D|nr:MULTISPECIES: flagellar motor protein MotB [unclassified Nitratiruptor]BCD60301.1 chemotaxis protein MotB [Nitratiruptor sp. YY08-10]BCD64209.1 chemotaxis protein MotB [Nitratiruptor sp. YY08-14]